MNRDSYMEVENDKITVLSLYTEKRMYKYTRQLILVINNIICKKYFWRYNFNTAKIKY